MRHTLLFVLALILSSACKFSEENGSDLPGSEPIENTPTLPEAQFPCEEGLADEEYPCQGFDLFARVDLRDLMATGVNDIWGWKDEETERYYALVGLLDGVTIVDITDPNVPVVVAKLNEPEKLQRSGAKMVAMDQIAHDDEGDGKGESSWRDLKVYRDHMFVVSDAQPHGMQVFDLRKLRDVADPPEMFQEDQLYEEFGAAHNIVINEESGSAYVVGNRDDQQCSNQNSLHMIDIRQPSAPTFAGCFDEPSIGNRIRPGYVHDAQCVIYDGPDSDYQDREICFNASELNFSIADVTDKASPQLIAATDYVNVEYAHQGWLSEDHRFFFLNDELDERRTSSNTRTLIFDVSDLDNPAYLKSFVHNTASIDHNLYVVGNLIYQSNYSSGLRLLRFEEGSDDLLSLAGYFDTHPEDDLQNFSGSWSNYPFFDTGVLIVSDRTRGLFILRPQEGL